MTISQFFKLCIVAGVVFTMFTGITFMMSSSDSDQMRNQVKGVVRQFKVDKVVSDGKNDVFESPKDGELQQPEQERQLEPDFKTTLVQTKTEEITVRPEVLRQLQEVKSIQSPSIQIFYYPWYDSPNYNNDSYKHWNHEYLPNWKKDDHVYPTGRHIPPDDIGSWYYPKLGPYSSRDPSVIDMHFRWMSTAGIDVAVVSWLPASETKETDYDWDSIVPSLLNASERNRMKLAFHLEPYKTRTADSVKNDIIYLIDKYGTHPAFYRTLPKNKTGNGETKEMPMFYIYDSYLIPKNEWFKVTNKNGSNTIRGTSYDSLLIGLYVAYEHRFDLQKAGFDGLYTYFASEGFSHGSTMANWPALSTFSAKNAMLFIPSVGPGYIDTRVRAWNDQNTKDRENGKYYREHFKMAHTAKADIVSITSFNEWHEGTQIEPAVAYKDGNFTYLVYDRNPEEYLEITLQMVKEYFTPHHENIPMQIAKVV